MKRQMHLQILIFSDVYGEPDLKISELIGKEVFGSMGVRIGRVTDGVIDPGTLKLQEIQIGLNSNIARDFGAKRTLRTTKVHVSSEAIMGVADVVSLRVSKVELQQLFHASMRG